MMHRTVWAISKQLERSDFVPKGYEIMFGAMSRISSSNISLDELGQMRLYGKIDRVDVCEDEENVYVKVVDYKTGEKSFDLGELCHGLQMQLVLYMNAAMELEKQKHPEKNIIPAGLFYYKMKDPLIDKMVGKEKVEDAILKELMPDGVVNASKVVLDHLEQTDDGTYKAIPVAVNKDGSLSKRSKVLSEEEFAVISNYAKHKLKEAGVEILNGNIDVAPYELGERRGCDYCPYHVVCGFEEQIPGYEYRTLDKISKEDALNRMSEEVDSWQ